VNDEDVEELLPGGARLLLDELESDRGDLSRFPLALLRAS
jgi:hypothetical protein